MNNDFNNKRGQAALEFLMTYGWAFLVMIAVIAAIVALDPMGMATSQQQDRCTLGLPWMCESDTIILEESGALTFLIQNEGASAKYIEYLNVTDTSDASGADISCTSNTTVGAGDELQVDCTGVTSNIQDTSILAGERYEFELELVSRDSDRASDFNKVEEFTITAQAQ